MAYETRYELQIEMANEQQLRELARILEEDLRGVLQPEPCEDLECSVCGVPGRYHAETSYRSGSAIGWYRHEEQLQRLSRQFLGILFVLAGTGEEVGDRWKKTFSDGEMTCEKLDDSDRLAAEVEMAAEVPVRTCVEVYAFSLPRMLRICTRPSTRERGVLSLPDGDEVASGELADRLREVGEDFGALPPAQLLALHQRLAQVFHARLITPKRKGLERLSDQGFAPAELLDLSGRSEGYELLDLALRGCLLNGEPYTDPHESYAFLPPAKAHELACLVRRLAEAHSPLKTAIQKELLGPLGQVGDRWVLLTRSLYC